MRTFDYPETFRLRFAPITARDSEFILRLMNDPDYHANIGDRGLRSVEDAVAYIARVLEASRKTNGFAIDQVILKETGESIGFCGIVKRDTMPDLDIGFAYLPEYRGKGYAVEAARSVVEYARSEMNLKRLTGIVSPHNVASMRVLEKSGLQFEKEFIWEADGKPAVLYGVNWL